MSTEQTEEISEEEIKTNEEISIDIDKLLEKLVPPDEIVILDIFGNEYKKPAIVSARKQIKVIRSFQKALSFAGESKLNMSDGVVSLIDYIVEIATDEKVMDCLGDCFTYAYPDVVEKSVVYAKDASISVDQNPALDLFSIEDIAGSIIPLFVRLAKKSGGAIKILTSLT